MSKRVWLLGNGPSLKYVDLDLLIGEEVWVLNLFNLAMEPDAEEGIRGTSLEPSRWWWMDHPRNGYQWQTLGWLINSGQPMFVRDQLIGELLACKIIKRPMPETLTAVVPDPREEWENCDLRNPNSIQGFHKWTLERNNFDIFGPCLPDFPNVYPHLVWRFTNSMAVLLQAAALEDYSEVYMLGCDGGIAPGKPDHFHSRYWKYDPNIVWATDLNLSLEITHRFAKFAYDERGIKGYNANPDGLGEIEIWPRIDYREVLDGR